MITLITTSAFASRGASTSYTISNVGGVCDTVLVFIRHNFLNGVNGVTYGGVAMTKLSQRTDANNHDHYIYGLKDCYIGTQNISIDCGAVSQNLYSGAATYKGVSRTATFPNVQGNDGIVSPPDNITVSVTTTVDSCLLVGYGGHIGSDSVFITADTGATEISSTHYGGGSGISDAIFEGSPFDSGTAGIKSMKVNIQGTSSQDFFLLVVALTPSTTLPVSSNVMII